MNRRRLSFGDVIFGEYEVLGLLGVGATSYVYRCHPIGGRGEVAVKVLHDDLVGKASSRKRFLREAHLMGRLDHPNVVKVYDIIEAPLTLAYVMELVEGPSLKAWMALRAPGMDAELAQVTLELLSGLGYAHAQGIVHRDIKPANILIEETAGRPVPRIIDFGVARLANAAPDPEDFQSIRGTAAYMSPDEIRSPHEVCPSSDLYSLGVVLYEMVAGRRPFEGVSGREVLIAHLHDEPQPPSTFNNDLPPAIDELILTLLAKTPEARFPSAMTMESELRMALTAPQTGFEQDAAEAWRWTVAFHIMLLHLLSQLVSPGNTDRPSDPHYLSRPYIDIPAVV